MAVLHGVRRPARGVPHRPTARASPDPYRPDPYQPDPYRQASPGQTRIGAGPVPAARPDPYAVPGRPVRRASDTPFLPPGPAAGPARLILESGLGKIEYPLDAPVVTIGRSRSNDISLEDSRVSRHHARIVRDARGFLIEDLNSRNGTRVDDRAVRDSATLTDGAIVRIGDSVFRFTVAPPSGAATVRRSPGPSPSGSGTAGYGPSGGHAAGRRRPRSSCRRGARSSARPARASRRCGRSCTGRRRSRRGHRRRRTAARSRWARGRRARTARTPSAGPAARGSGSSTPVARPPGHEPRSTDERACSREEHVRAIPSTCPCSRGSGRAGADRRRGRCRAGGRAPRRSSGSATGARWWRTGRRPGTGSSAASPDVVLAVARAAVARAASTCIGGFGSAGRRRRATWSRWSPKATARRCSRRWRAARTTSCCARTTPSSCMPASRWPSGSRCCSASSATTRPSWTGRARRSGRARGLTR